MKINGKTKKQQEEDSVLFLKKIKLLEYAEKYPHELSGGMRQRVAIARTLCNEPKIILMDEPFGALDYQTRLAMNSLLLEIWKEHKITIIFVTHDIDESILLSDKIFLMSPSPGRIAKTLSIDLDRPRDINNQKFIDYKIIIQNHLKQEV